MFFGLSLTKQYLKKNIYNFKTRKLSKKRLLREQDFFKKLDKKKYIVWTDTGPHFRCSEFLYYLFNELALEKIEVNYNLFCEKHGMLIS